MTTAGSLTAQTKPVGFANVLDRTGQPQAMRDVVADGHQQFSPLFDLGSWHGYLLPADSGDYGGFPGPMIVAEEYSVYLARQLDQLTRVDTAGIALPLSRARAQIESRAGVLRQEFRFDDLELHLALRMASARSAVVVTTLRNTGRSGGACAGAGRCWTGGTAVAAASPRHTRIGHACLT
jgi:putative isomerase